MTKITNDVRGLVSGPRDSIGEITIPANEPGSFIMRGKVNPAQCKAVAMVAVQVMGNDTAIGIDASQGDFELNVFMPVIAYNYLQPVRLLLDAICFFTKHCASGIKANKQKMHYNLHRSLIVVTILSRHIGYEHAAKVVQYTFAHNTSLWKACVSLGYLSEEKFDSVFKPEEMV